MCLLGEAKDLLYISNESHGKPSRCWTDAFINSVMLDELPAEVDTDAYACSVWGDRIGGSREAAGGARRDLPRGPWLKSVDL